MSARCLKASSWIARRPGRILAHRFELRARGGGLARVAEAPMGSREQFQPLAPLMVTLVGSTLCPLA